MKTALIKKEEIEKAFSMKEYIATLEKAFKLYGEGKVQMPPKVYLTFEKGDLRCMPVHIPDMKIAGVKNVNVHPHNKELPTVMATITLVDPESGFPLAIMDGTHITNMRTGAAGGIAVKYLSKKDAKSVAFIGTGAQARTQLEAIMEVRRITKVLAYSPTEKSRDLFLKHVKEKYDVACSCSKTAEEAIVDTDIVVTTTPSRKPIVMADWIKPGTHVNAIGADAAGKEELEPVLLKKARIVIDNWEQASHSGEINVPIAKGVITRKDIYADIGEIVTGKKKARENDNEITVFDSTGLAIQDISCATEIYRKLKNEEGFEFF
ncbi:alanine dehydrogenase [Candidatus Woesearchaeota archaeon]|nr:alanine dehydrogenase [Candidatus Woesearchaeota archaeon]